MSDLWDEVIGIPVEDWLRACTPTQVAWLIWLRDNPLPAQPLPEHTCDTIDIRGYDGTLIRTLRIPRHAEECVACSHA